MSSLRYTDIPANSQFFRRGLLLWVATCAECTDDLVPVTELTLGPPHQFET